MCGIYGTTIQYEGYQIKAKLERTQFRGPDKTDFKSYSFNDSQVYFGHNRLSIVDLDARSNQPFNYIDKLEIVFNGEIYNFIEIKEELKQKGYKFTTTSDTEVICAAYLEYGFNCVDKLNGMFAFVIYDIGNQKFFGARDRLGQKPFYYFHDKNNFEFASQISSIQLFNKRLSISSKAIRNYLSWGVVPDSMSIFNEVKKLEAGHYFTYNLNNGDFKSQVYWDIDSFGKNKFSGSYDEALNKLEILTTKAVKNRLVADVPVGVFLSGGIDSSLIAALATKTTTDKIKTFSVKFNEKGFDESSYAQQVADHLKTDHHVINCNYNEGLDLIKDFSHYYDEPFADSSAIPSMLLAKHTKKHVTVALSGDGGDESFIGYHRYNWVTYMNMIYKLPKPLRLLVASSLNILPHYKLKIISSVIKNDDVNNAYLSTIYGSAPSWVDNSIPTDSNFEELKYLFHNSKNIYERVSDFDIKTYLNWDINTKVDRASMAYSLEARAPLMDYNIVDFARSLPTDFKYKKDNQKRILKDILYKHVPKEIFDRPKAGFTMPFKEWFKYELKDFILSELSEENLKSIPNIKSAEITKMINQHMNGSWNRYHIIWKLIVLKQWLNNNESGISIK
ncbi:asparagine synthase (glutamine-hydrolyzing) [Hyunsoonleella pacifica]|uniref:asparagine synthase (glutamine-hydrolyzing) n=1 Tax=Hyunsoonleella pacifica TaxID=1080224 RepID=A0A4Q9FQD9_9FLAO|nr:asparagine synthase (glutamine-hydrolyzing) [Hyunsoonleella pacifica]TBN17661.1 asparagine synthase (glutamine-hydrolyzing) [Hyunsoonleella pacifica]GGD10067.1 asparagine synthetase B [Hyunsoonleella pacifica]